jgi:hypothetical protein
LITVPRLLELIDDGVLEAVDPDDAATILDWVTREATATVGMYLDPDDPDPIRLSKNRVADLAVCGRRAQHALHDSGRGGTERMFLGRILDLVVARLSVTGEFPSQPFEFGIESARIVEDLDVTAWAGALTQRDFHRVRLDFEQMIRVIAVQFPDGRRPIPQLRFKLHPAADLPVVISGRVDLLYGTDTGASLLVETKLRLRDDIQDELAFYAALATLHGTPVAAVAAVDTERRVAVHLPTAETVVATVEQWVPAMVRAAGFRHGEPVDVTPGVWCATCRVSQSCPAVRR